jgi:methylenetetrahydrofolate dehydrogenase (NADP+)/methenyltetrahydrofolate cyclohydrolase
MGEYTRKADILIAAAGKPEMITANMVKDGVVIIDVGVNRISADNEKGYRLVGDVAFDEVSQKAAAITPVPGGVGPMTIAMLLKNTLKAVKIQN